MNELLEWMEYIEDSRQQAKARHELKDILGSYSSLHLPMWTTGWRWNISPITIQGRKDSVLQCCLVSFNIILYVTGGQDDTIRIK